MWVSTAACSSGVLRSSYQGLEIYGIRMKNASTQKDNLKFL
jgi:hypothetical protein